MPLYTTKPASKQAQSGGANFPANRTRHHTRGEAFWMRLRTQEFTGLPTRRVPGNPR
jgi:hypothetical protein